MTDTKPERNPAAPDPASFKDAARRSQDAGIADETAAYENAIEDDDTLPADDRTTDS